MGKRRPLQSLTKAELIARLEQLERESVDTYRTLTPEQELNVHQAELVLQNQELREVTQQLELSRNKYAELYDFAPVGYLTVDVTGVIRQLNLTAIKMLGPENRNMRGTLMTMYVNTMDRDQLRYHINSSFKEDRKITFELRLRSSLTVVQVDTIPSLDPQTGERLLWMTLTDITERKRDEQLVQQAHARVVTLIESTDDAIWTIDINHRILISNFRFREMQSELLADPFYQNVLTLSTRQRELRLWWRQQYIAVTKGEKLRKEVSVLIGEKEVHFDVIMNPLSGPSGITGAVVIARDITAQRKTEQALVRAKERAEELTQSKSLFLAHIAHEIRTPLNAILNFAVLLRRKATDPALDRYANSIVENSKRLAETTSDLLSLSKFEANKVIAHLMPVDAALEVERTMDQLGQLAEAKGLKMSLETRYSEILINADPKYFRQIISNLLTNAIKFTDSGSVTITITKEDDLYALLSVKDTGIGIAHQNLDRIFDEFYQEPLESHDQNVGAGLGLPIVKKHCELMGASIAVTSEIGQGSTFLLKFPLSK